MKREIPTITISCGKNDMFLNPPCNFRPNVSTSTSYFSGVSIREINIPDTSAPSRKEFLDSLTQLQPYVGRDFVPYTQPSQPFVQPDIPHYIPPNKELSTSEKKVLITDFTKILRDLYPKDYSKHIDTWPNTLWGKMVINKKDFQAIENFFVTEFVDVLHKRYPHDYRANFKDWNSKNSQWGKEVILTKNFKAIGKWLPTYKKEVLEQQKVLKTDFVEILHRVYPEDYPMNFKDWNNIWGKDVLERGDFKAIAKHLPNYKKQALKKEQNILFLVKDKSDVYLGGMSIGDYGVKLIIGGVADKLTTLNLANNQIRDDGAKLLATSLSNGQMPNLKKLHLEGNKITDKGDNFIISAIKNIKQHIIVLIRDLKGDGKMIFGSKEEKIIEYKKILAKCSEQGINNQVIVVNKTSFDKAKNLGLVGTSIVVGFSKCHWELETLTQWYAQDKILAKLPKIGKVLVNTFNADDILSCYVEAKKEAFTSPIGCEIIKDELCVMGETEFCE